MGIIFSIFYSKDEPTERSCSRLRKYLIDNDEQEEYIPWYNTTEFFQYT